MFDHGESTGNTIEGTRDSARRTMNDLAEVGVDFADMLMVLENEDIQKFEDCYTQLADRVKSQLVANERGAIRVALPP